MNHESVSRSKGLIRSDVQGVVFVEDLRGQLKKEGREVLSWTSGPLVTLLLPNNRTILRFTYALTGLDATENLVKHIEVGVMCPFRTSPYLVSSRLSPLVLVTNAPQK